MAEQTNLAQIAPPLPAREEIVKDEVLSSRQFNTLALSLGFGGVSNPTVIWTSMVRDHPTAYAFYRELEEKDEDVGDALEMLKLSVMEREREILPFDDSS